MGDTEPYPRSLGDAHPTVPIPGEVRLAADEPLPHAAPSESARRRRKRWPWVLLILVIVIAGLVVAAEFIARAAVDGIVRSEVVKTLDLPADQEMEVETEGILLPQLIAGRLDHLQVSSDEVVIGPFAGAVTAQASGIPLHGGDLSSAEATVRMTADQLAGLIATTDLPVEDIVIEGSDITASGAVSVLGLDMPLGLTLTPGAQDGDLALTPVSITVAGMTFTADDLGGPLASMADSLTATQTICIAEYLPAGVHLRTLTATDGAITAWFDVDGAIASDERLQENGSCG